MEQLLHFLLFRLTLEILSLLIAPTSCPASSSVACLRAASSRCQ